ncbi:hypothetical protein [Paenibacillus harenae]|uniref:hypothetical protein n=1 Tax=Paenibacillus harenae TaxID=306543 RepID=UPI00049073CE|nr:hypothetical protein [Paenibacillus harenae]
MKKKWMTMGAVFGLGVVMLIASGVSAMAGTSGYDVYKAAIKNSHTVSSVTSAGTITVTDNGSAILSADLLAKMNHGQDAMSASVNFRAGSEEKKLSMFKQDGKVILNTGESEVYKQLEAGEAEWQKDESHAGPPKHMESVIDALMGNLKELATVEQSADGGKHASLHMSGSQIPAVVNAVGTLAISNMADHGQWANANIDSEMHVELMSKMPKLTDRIQVKEINFDADINAENYIEHQTAELVVTGSDEAGTTHEVVITLDFKMSDFNQTVPDTIDLTGKQVETIQRDEHNEHNFPWHH